MKITLHKDDLPERVELSGSVAVDTETMGLNPARDRLCLVQLCGSDGKAHLVQIRQGERGAPRLQRLLTDKTVLKIFHFARFDLAALQSALGVMPEPIYCTKIASKLVRTYTDRHGLKDLCRELLAGEAESLSDEEVELIRRHADAMAHLLIEIAVQGQSEG